MTGIATSLSIITLNDNGHNSPIKKQRLINFIKKQDQIICHLKETNSLAKTAQTYSERKRYSKQMESEREQE
jgi:hypothetical protein